MRGVRGACVNARRYGARDDWRGSCIKYGGSRARAKRLLTTYVQART